MSGCVRPLRAAEVEQAGRWADEAGDVTEAERLYRRCIAPERTDPCAAFSLGNLLRRRGRREEAKLYLRLAAGIDPGFAEAWYNPALPRYGDALFDAAMISFEMGDYAKAGDLWERCLAIDANGERAKNARHALAYCRRMTRSQTASDEDAAPAGPGP